MFNNLRELIMNLPTEEKCREYLAEQRWAGKPVCPYCGGGKVYKIEQGKRYKCGDKTCYKKFSVTVGTVFEASNVPLTKWFTAVYLCTAHKKGISSYQLAKDIGVSQKSAWFMLHRIREMVRQPLKRKLDNIVEADETYIGGSITNKHYKVRKQYREGVRDWGKNKTTALGMLERDGQLKMEVIEGEAPKEIETAIRGNLEYAANLITDEAAMYKPLNNDYYHNTVNHSKNEFVRLHLHTNTIEGAFSHLKRMIYGIYHQISPKHTSRYLDEFTYRYNSRTLKDAARFTISLQGAEGRLTYKNLIQVKEKYQAQQVPNAYLERLKKPVIQRSGDELIATYPSIEEAGRMTGIPSHAIRNNVKGKNSNAGGFQWELA